jgi:hypothetical protein
MARLCRRPSSVRQLAAVPRPSRTGQQRQTKRSFSCSFHRAVCSTANASSPRSEAAAVAVHSALVFRWRSSSRA